MIDTSPAGAASDEPDVADVADVVSAVAADDDPHPARTDAATAAVNISATVFFFILSSISCLVIVIFFASETCPMPVSLTEHNISSRTIYVNRLTYK